MIRVDHGQAGSGERGTVVLLHGFARAPFDLAEVAERCRMLGARVQSPRLSAWWWPTSTNNTRYLDHLADVVAVEEAGPIVVVGHSAGGAAGAWIAARLRRRGARVGGLVLVDAVESPVKAIRRSWRTLEDVSITAILGAPSRCNRHGALGRWLHAQGNHRHAPMEVIDVPNMGHGDIEGEGVGLYVRMCGDDPSAPARGELLALVSDAVTRGLDADAK